MLENVNQTKLPVVRGPTDIKHVGATIPSPKKVCAVNRVYQMTTLISARLPLKHSPNVQRACVTLSGIMMRIIVMKHNVCMNPMIVRLLLMVLLHHQM